MVLRYVPAFNRIFWGCAGYPRCHGSTPARQDNGYPEGGAVKVEHLEFVLTNDERDRLWDRAQDDALLDKVLDYLSELEMIVTDHFGDAPGITAWAPPAKDRTA